MSYNDCDVVYIGETGRILKERTEEHSNDLNKTKDRHNQDKEDIAVDYLRSSR